MWLSLSFVGGVERVSGDLLFWGLNFDFVGVFVMRNQKVV